MNSFRPRFWLVLCGCGIGLALYTRSHSLAPAVSLFLTPTAALSPALITFPASASSGQGADDAENWRTVRNDLFTAPSASNPLPLPDSEKPMPPLPAPFVPALPTFDPLTDYVYSGTVNEDGTVTALIEQRGTKQGWFVQSGDTWLTYDIVEVTEQAVTVMVAGQKYTLLKSDAINLVPLLADADKRTSTGEANGLPQIAQEQTSLWSVELDESRAGLVRQWDMSGSADTYSPAWQIQSSTGSINATVNLQDGGVLNLENLNTTYSIRIQLAE